ncbi:unnamed protein product [Adineta ricciae]|uniref:Uncharacterized protein n=1 Tax=Adineta ricciae TaxID=249248 RepID=A0A814Y1F0_ADIRI|nr:unnamed protein product [Adineta ricciae]
MDILFIILIDIVSFTTISSLSCITLYDQKYIKKDDANADDIKKHLDRYNVSKVNGTGRCIVLMRITSDSSRLLLEFNGLISYAYVAHGQINFQTIISMNNKRKTNAENYLLYSCSQPDGCEKQFIYKNIDWFSMEYFEKVQQTVRSLFSESFDFDIKCFNKNNTAKKCSNKVCVYSYPTKENHSTRMCAPQPGLPHYLEINSKINTINKTEYRSFQLRCNGNKCNSEENTLELQRILHEYYDLSPLQNNPIYTNISIDAMKTTTKSSTRRTKKKRLI